MSEEPAVFSIENEVLKACIKSKGAELTSLQTKDDGTEYIWQGAPGLYRPQAEFLFPIIGFTARDEVVFEGKTYRLPPHGFVKDTLFRAVPGKENEIAFECRDTPQTLAVYPFKFSLRIVFALKSKALEMSCTVSNLDSKTMFFSLGQHPGFTCPIESRLSLSDYRLVFSEEEDLSYRIYSYDDKALTKDSKRFLSRSRDFPLSHDVLIPGPMVLENMASNAVTLCSDKGSKALTVHMPGYPCCAIWSSPKPANFVCIQPWHGVLGSIDGSNDLALKDGMRALEPAATFSCAHSFEVH